MDADAADFEVLAAAADDAGETEKGEVHRRCAQARRAGVELPLAGYIWREED